VDLLDLNDIPMPIIYDLAREKSDPWYKKGMQEGLQEGREEGRDGVVINLLRMGKLTIDEIALAAETSVDFVLKIKADLD
jgi:predicted transposase YdaD